MKQLKVVVDDYNSSTGLVTAKFYEPVMIAVGSKIAMDKFSMSVNSGSSSNFVLDTQTVNIRTAYRAPPYGGSSTPYRSAVIQGGTFENVDTLLSSIQQSFNSILNSDMTNIVAPKVPDNGLSFITSIDKDNIATIYFTCGSLDDTTTPNSKNVTVDSAGFYLPTQPAIGATTDSYVVFESPLIQGALDCRFRADLNFAECNVTEWGLTDNLTVAFPNLLYGFRIKADDTLYIVNGALETPIADITPFSNHPNYIHQFYVNNGKLQYQIVNSNLAEVYYRSNPDDFNGFNFNTNYFLGFRNSYTAIDATNRGDNFGEISLIYQPASAQNNVGWYFDPELLDNRQYLSTLSNFGDTPARVVQYDFTSSETLRRGLGLDTNLFTLPSGISGAIVGSIAVNFSQYYNLCLDVTNLPLESYISLSSRNTGGRRNILCYFSPQRLTTSGTQYNFEAKTMNFVATNNKDIRNIESLTFRIYDPIDVNSFLVCNSMSFNIYIEEPE